MINKITFKEEPTLFNDITELSIEVVKVPRRGATFFRHDIIEFTKEEEIYYPEVADYDKYIGTWRTNEVIWHSDNGFDEEEYSELIRVEKKEKLSYEWVDIK